MGKCTNRLLLLLICLLGLLVPIAGQPVKNVRLLPHKNFSVNPLHVFSYDTAALLEKCQTLYKAGKYDSLLAIIGDKIPLLADSFGKRKEFRFYNVLGYSAMKAGDYSLALKYYTEPLKFTGVDSSKTYSNIGIMWHSIGLTSEALSMFGKAAAIAERKKDYETLIIIRTNCAFLYLRLEQLGTAETIFREVYDLSEKHKYIQGKISAYWGLARMYQQKANYQLSLAYLTDSMQLLVPGQKAAATIDCLIGINYYYLKNYSKARGYLFEIYDAAIANNDKNMLLEVAPFASELYAMKGDHAKAYEISNHYIQIKDSIDAKERADIINGWAQAKIAEKDNLILEKQLHIARQDNEIKSRNLWGIGGIASAGLLVLLLFGSIRQHRHKIVNMRHEQEIIRLKAQLKGEELERSRIAVELHNGIIGQVFAAKMEISNLNRQAHVPSRQDGFEEICTQLESIADDIRNTAHNLAPGLLLDEGLIKALESFCQKMAGSSGIEAKFLVCGHVIRLDKDIELLIFRIVQELVQNIIKHANKASYFLVQIGCNDFILNLTVEDNGQGFDSHNIVMGLGLKSIREKIKAIGGSFDLQSNPGSGTTVYIELPVEEFFLGKKVNI